MSKSIDHVNYNISSESGYIPFIRSDKQASVDPYCIVASYNTTDSSDKEQHGPISRADIFIIRSSNKCVCLI